jgi:PKHD-type hydroxylase
VTSYASHVVIDAAFTADDCRAIAAIGDALDTGGGQLVGDVDTDDDTDVGLRRSRVAWIGRDDETGWIFDRLSELVVRANRTWRFDIEGFEEDLQYTVYDEPGAFYTWHQDGLDGDVATRKMALVVQLTPPDEYDGGDLELFDVVCDWAPEDLAGWRDRVRGLGSATAFPAFEYHRVTPMVSGRRASLVAWVGGPPFR